MNFELTTNYTMRQRAIAAKTNGLEFESMYNYSLVATLPVMPRLERPVVPKINCSVEQVKFVLWESNAPI